jgi:hypothetical protein
MTPLSTFKRFLPAAVSVLALFAAAASVRGQEDDKPVFRRDPFWPVGFEKDYKVEELRLDALAAEQMSDGKPASADWAVARKLLNVSGVAWNNVATNKQCVAIVNGRVFEVGDPVVVEAKGFRYQWVVTAISRKEVLFEKVNVNPINKKTRMGK